MKSASSPPPAYCLADIAARLLTGVCALLSFFSLCLIIFLSWDPPGQTPHGLSHLLGLSGVTQLLTLLGLDDLDSSEGSQSGVP